MNSPDSGQIRAAFWNLQNLFDLEPSPMSFDLGVTAINGWDRRALEARITSLAGSIRSMFDGQGPDVIGLAEVENDRVAQHLLSALGREDYVLITANHPLIASTGTALICSNQVFDEASIQTRGHLVHLRFPTCDILEVRLKTRSNGCDLTVLVNHWPSRREQNSDAFRRTTASYCARLVEQQFKLSRRDYLELNDTELARHQIADRWNSNLLLMGSFNDEPWAPSLREILNAGNRLRAMRGPVPFPRGVLPSWRAYSACRPELFNTSWSLLSEPDCSTAVDSVTHEPMGVLDHLILSRGLVTGLAGLKVATDAAGIPSMRRLSMETVADQNGLPVPFNGDTYEGFSDHLPIGCVLEALPRTDRNPVQAALPKEENANESLQ